MTRVQNRERYLDSRGHEVEVIAVFRARGQLRVKYAYWTGPLRGDVCYEQINDFRRAFRRKGAP